MSDDLSRSARQLLNELRAAEAYVRASAARALPWPSMARMERRASERCHELLTELGVVHGGPLPQTERMPIRARPPTPPDHAPVGPRTSPAPSDRLVETPSMRGHSPQQPPVDPRPAAPRARTTLNTAPQVEDLDDQLTVAAGPPKPGTRPAIPRAPMPPAPRARAAAPVEEVPTAAPAGAPARAQDHDIGLVTFAPTPAEPSLYTTPEGAEPAQAPAPETPATVALHHTPPVPAQSRTATPATSGLYGGAVPAVRGAESLRPRAAAIQLNAGGTGGKVLLDEDDEPIEVEEASQEFVDNVDGFAVSLHEDEVSYEPTPEPAPEPEPEPIPEAPPPTADEIASLLAQAQSVAATGNLHGATQLYSDVIDMAPEHARAHVSRGRLYLDLGDYSRAMSDFMVAEDLAPDDPETHVAIGDLYFHRKEYRRAIDYFSSALDVAPEHAMAHCRRGICHYYRKNFRVALEDLLRAKDLQPDIPNITAYVSRARKKAASQRA